MLLFERSLYVSQSQTLLVPEISSWVEANSARSCYYCQCTVTTLTGLYNQKQMGMCCSALCLHYRAGAPGCGQRHTSSGPLKAPPRGCPDWSAVGPVSPASHAHAPAAQRSTPYLDIRWINSDRWNVSNLLRLQEASCKVRGVSMAPDV